MQWTVPVWMAPFTFCVCCVFLCRVLLSPKVSAALRVNPTLITACPYGIWSPSWSPSPTSSSPRSRRHHSAPSTNRVHPSSPQRPLHLLLLLLLSTHPPPPLPLATARRGRCGASASSWSRDSGRSWRAPLRPAPRRPPPLPRHPAPRSPRSAWTAGCPSVATVMG